MFSLLIGRTGANTLHLPQGVCRESTENKAVCLARRSRLSWLRLQSPHPSGISDSNASTGRKLADPRERTEPHDYRVSTKFGEDARLSPAAGHKTRGFSPERWRASPETDCRGSQQLGGSGCPHSCSGAHVRTVRSPALQVCITFLIHLYMYWLLIV